MRKRLVPSPPFPLCQPSRPRLCVFTTRVLCRRTHADSSRRCAHTVYIMLRVYAAVRPPIGRRVAASDVSRERKREKESEPECRSSSSLVKGRSFLGQLRPLFSNVLRRRVSRIISRLFYACAFIRNIEISTYPNIGAFLSTMVSSRDISRHIARRIYRGISLRAKNALGHAYVREITAK